MDLKKLHKIPYNESDHKIKMYDSRKTIHRLGIFFWDYTMKPRIYERLLFLQSTITNDHITKILIPLICMNSTVSLRLINWFVISYCKNHNFVTKCSSKRNIHVYQSYRTWLKYWKRELFDAFRRGPRIYFVLTKQTYSTTVAQLNYIFWALSNDILKFLLTHHIKMSKIMTKSMRDISKTEINHTTCIIYEH